MRLSPPRPFFAVERHAISPLRRGGAPSARTLGMGSLPRAHALGSLQCRPGKPGLGPFATGTCGLARCTHGKRPGNEGGHREAADLRRAGLVPVAARRALRRCACARAPQALDLLVLVHFIEPPLVFGVSKHKNAFSLEKAFLAEANHAFLNRVGNPIDSAEREQ